MRERMNTHALDGFSLISGLVFLAVGALVLVDAAAEWDVDPRWIVATLLVGLGIAAVLGSVDWARRSSEPGEPPDHEPSTHQEER